jgi:4-amino-4-deoxy-L-arabinose transferase-like glycosyltransferase
MLKKLISFAKEHKIEFLLLLLILVAAAFFRLYRISEYMTFLGDEGRDVLVVKKFITQGDLMFIGPTTSIGNMYLGPLYYYMMAPFLFIWRLSPLGPAVMVALLGVASVFLVYFLGKIFFSSQVGIFASALYAISPSLIISSRSSWNPNPMPFFAILVILSLYKLIETKRPIWLLLTGGALAFALQMHYLGLLLIPMILIFWFWQLISIRHTPFAIRQLLLWSLVSGLLFLALMSPLLIFDLNPSHRFLNFNAFKKFFLERAATEEHLATVNLNPLNALPRVIPLYTSFFERFITAKNALFGNITAILAIFGIFSAGFLNYKNKLSNLGIFILGIWILIGILGISLYQLAVFDHYFGFLAPAAFLMVGIFLWLFWRGNILFKTLSVLIFLFLVFINLQNSPTRIEPNRQLQRTIKIAKFIISESERETFNFALLAKNNYDAAYQYYLDLLGAKPKDVSFEKTDQLFVVCEDPVCNPIGHPKTEIARFGWAKIDKIWNVSGVKLYRLTPNPEGKPQQEFPEEIKVN